MLNGDLPSITQQPAPENRRVRNSPPPAPMCDWRTRRGFGKHRILRCRSRWLVSNEGERADLWTDIDVVTSKTSVLSSPPPLSQEPNAAIAVTKTTQARSLSGSCIEEHVRRDRVLDAIETHDDPGRLRMVPASSQGGGISKSRRNGGERVQQNLSGTAPSLLRTAREYRAPWAMTGSRHSSTPLRFYWRMYNRRFFNEHRQPRRSKNGVKPTIFRTRYRPKAKLGAGACCDRAFILTVISVFAEVPQACSDEHSSTRCKRVLGCGWRDARGPHQRGQG